MTRVAISQGFTDLEMSHPARTLLMIFYFYVKIHSEKIPVSRLGPQFTSPPSQTTHPNLYSVSSEVQSDRCCLGPDRPADIVIPTVDSGQYHIYCI